MKVGLVATPIVDTARPPNPGDSGLTPVGADALRPCPPYAVYLLAGALEQSDHEAVVIDLIADGKGCLDPGQATSVEDLDLIGVSASSLSWAAARLCIANIRARRPDLPIVVGGVHASQFDAWVLETSAADAVVRGDGEQPLIALCRAIERDGDLAEVPSLTWRSPDGSLRRNPDGPSVESADLTRWFPSYEQLPSRAYFGLSLETSRGCAFACSFCSTPHKRRWRGGDPHLVVDRLERLVPYLDRVITPSVYIVDDEFTMNPRRAMEIAAGLSERELPMGLLYDSRAPDLLRAGLVDALAPHTRSLLVGAECGYDEGLRRVGKGTTCDVLRSAASRLARAGIAERADFSFILGFPWERPDELRRTVDFGFDLAEAYGVRALFNWYAQIPGSELWDAARAAGAIHESRYDRLGVQRDPGVFFNAVRFGPAEVTNIVDHGQARRNMLGDHVPAPEFQLPVSMTRPLGAGASDPVRTRRPVLGTDEQPVGDPTTNERGSHLR